VLLQAATLAGSDFPSVTGQSPWPAGEDGMPATVSVKLAALLQATAGPESWHCCEPGGRLTLPVSGNKPCEEQLASGPQTTDRVAWSAGMSSTAGVAARAMTLRWFETAMNATAR